MCSCFNETVLMRYCMAIIRMRLRFLIFMDHRLSTDPACRQAAGFSLDFRIRRSGVVGRGVVVLRLSLVNVRKLICNVVTLRLYQPFRAHALSYPAWWAAQGGQPITWLAFVVIIPALVLVLWRAERRPAGFALGVGLVCLVFFAFNKQAFCNYYYFVIAALCCALAVSKPLKPQSFAAEAM